MNAAAIFIDIIADEEHDPDTDLYPYEAANDG
jgi:hypothetical protein